MITGFPSPAQGFDTVRELNGIRCIDKIARKQKDIITTSRQFSIKVYDLAAIESAIVQYAELAVEKLRLQKCECGGVHILISTCNYYSDDKSSRYSNGMCAFLARQTSYTPDIVYAAREILKQVYREGYGN